MKGRRYAPWLFGLLGLFVFRVAAQLIQAIHPIDTLPPFESWQGSAMPYPLLLGVQLAIIFALWVTTSRITRDAIIPSKRKYMICFIFGGAYFTIMVFRLGTGLTVLDRNPWFSTSLPAFFHLVLAVYILLLGYYIYSRTRTSPH